MINALLIDFNLFDMKEDALNHIRLNEECLYYKNINIENTTINDNTLTIINNCISKIVHRFWYIATYDNDSNIPEITDGEVGEYLLMKALEYDDNLTDKQLSNYINNNHNIDMVMTLIETYNKNDPIPSKIDFIDEISESLKERNVSKDSFDEDKDFHWIFSIELYSNYIKNYSKLLNSLIT